MKRLFLLLLSLFIFSLTPVLANPILQCSSNGGSFSTGGCSTTAIFSNMSASLDWGAPTTAGGWAAHPLEQGFGQATGGNTHNIASLGAWNAVGSDGVQVGVNAGPGIGGSNQVLQRTDNARLFYDPYYNGGNGWDAFSSTTNPYYTGWSVFNGRGNSAPVLPDLGATGTTNTTNQFFSGPNFFSHGSAGAQGPTGDGASTTAVPYVGDHYLGYQTNQGQDFRLTFDNGQGGGVDGVALQINAKSNTQTLNQSNLAGLWLSGGGTIGTGLLELIIKAYSNTAGTGIPIATYEIITNGGYGTCPTLSNNPGDGSGPTPCNDLPVINIQGTPGVYNIKSITISSNSDAAGFFLNQLYYDEASGVGVGAPEPGASLLIGGGLVALMAIARRRRNRRS
jgi:hypothetical protein